MSWCGPVSLDAVASGHPLVDPSPTGHESIDNNTANTYPLSMPHGTPLARRVPTGVSLAASCSSAVALALVIALASGCGAASSGASSPAGSASVTAPTTTAPPATAAVRLAADLPVGHTPPGGYGTTMPPPVLDGCTEPLVAGAPDLRGMWKVVSVEVAGQPAPADHPAQQHVERVEQCGDRIVVTAGGVVHDMRADGTEEHGVHDVAAKDFTTPITVVATYEGGVHVLRPVGVGVEVRRSLDGEQLVWDYVGFKARLERTGPADGPAPT
jgi:hypothetical protein